MKKSKIVILLFSIFLLCGCNAKMVINVDKYEINEKLSFEGETQNIDDAQKKESIFEKYYDYEKNEEAREYSKTFSIESYQDNGNITQESVISNCFRYTKIDKDLDTGYITLKIGEFRCEEELEKIEKLDVVIKTEGRIVSSNITAEKSNELSYTFTKDNYKENYIYITIGFDEEIDDPSYYGEGGPGNNLDLEETENGEWINATEIKEEEKEKEESKQQLILLASIVGGFILIVIVAFFVSVYKANKNK